MVFSLETLSDNKTDKNGRIDGRFSLLTLAFQAKHGVKLLCGDYRERIPSASSSIDVRH